MLATWELQTMVTILYLNSLATKNPFRSSANTGVETTPSQSNFGSEIRQMSYDLPEATATPRIHFNTSEVRGELRKNPDWIRFSGIEDETTRLALQMWIASSPLPLLPEFGMENDATAEDPAPAAALNNAAAEDPIPPLGLPAVLSTAIAAAEDPIPLTGRPASTAGLLAHMKQLRKNIRTAQAEEQELTQERNAIFERLAARSGLPGGSLAEEKEEEHAEKKPDSYFELFQQLQCRIARLKSEIDEHKAEEHEFSLIL